MNEQHTVRQLKVVLRRCFFGLLIDLSVSRMDHFEKSSISSVISVKCYYYTSGRLRKGYIIYKIVHLSMILSDTRFKVLQVFAKVIFCTIVPQLTTL